MDYKEKLKLAKEALASGSYDKDTIEYIFPELKESENEKKQEDSDFIDIPFGAFDSELYHEEIYIPDGFEATIKGNRVILKRKESEDERIRKAIHIYFDWLDGRKDYAPKGKYSIKYMIAWLEKQGDKQNWKPSKEQINALEHFIRSVGESGYASPYNSNTQPLKSLLNDLYKLEEQCKQNQEANYPKFHEGDWVVWRVGELSATLQIIKVDIDKKLYWFNDNSYLPICDEEYLHYWTIHDTKPCDVLAFDNIIVMFKDLYKSTFHSYCYIEHGAFCISKDNISDWWQSKGFQPATKEQYDALVKAMTDAGYTFDFKKKELKKVDPTKCGKKNWGRIESAHSL